MKGFLSRIMHATGSLVSRTIALAHALWRWLAPPAHFLPTLLAVLFTVSATAWAISDRPTPYVLYFPTLDGRADRGERRNIPWKSDIEGQCEALAGEFLLGPFNPALKPALPIGTRLSSLMYRDGQLFVDLGEEAALVPLSDLERAIASL